MRKQEDRKNAPSPKKEKVEVRRDLEDASAGKDLSYLNEMPQMGGYEGVKAGAPPPKQKATTNSKKQ